MMKTMIIAPETIAFDRGVSPILQRILPGRVNVVLNFRPDPVLQQRVEELATKSTRS